MAELFQALGEQIQVMGCQGNLDTEVRELTDDSRMVKSGDLFVAVRGTQVDGHQYIDRAIRAGAAAVVIDNDLGEELSLLTEKNLDVSSIPLIQVNDSRYALGVLAANVHGNPSRKLRVIGVTGTNGKTTVTYLCKAILESAGKKVGLIGTVNYQIGSKTIPASHTTPGAVEFQGLLSHMVTAGLDTVVMEVSSHALALDRTVGCEFDVAVFTNLTQDHLDFHGTLDDYFQTKQKLFTALSSSAKKPEPKRAIINIDDPKGALLCKTTQTPIWTYSLTSPADIRAEQVQLTLEGTQFLAETPQGSIRIATQLVGEHNVYNLLCAIGVALQEGLSLSAIKEGLKGITNIPGRFERVNAGQAFTVIVDYAHTDDALDRLLTAAQTLKQGRVLTVFGCGGDRDRGKRPKMGKVAAEKSDLVFLTSDNPRTEDPMAIIRDVEVGIREVQEAGRKCATGYKILPDRALAIEAAIREAQAGDMVLIAGKGHEDYQIIGTQRHHFDDREVARAAIEKVYR